MPRARILRRSGPWLLIVVAAGLSPARVHGQQIAWRDNYNSARREAAEKGKPILIDFQTEACIWCRRLEAGPFRDPTVAGMLAERFVTLKIDADREPRLAAALNVNTYPTVVIAASDGKILGLIEGYVEAPKLTEQLTRAVAAMQDPDWMLKDYQEAAKAVAANDFGRAVALLKSISEDGQTRAVQVKARTALADLEAQAANKLAHAKQLHDRGQSREAAEQLATLMRTHAGTQATKEAATLLAAAASKPELQADTRQRRARELLAQAKDEFRAGAYMNCLDRCDTLASGYADLAEGAEARQVAAQIKENPELLAKAVESLNRRVGVMYLALAESYMAKGQHQQAQLCLEKVVRDAPGTQHADTALVKLTQLGSSPTQQTNFKK